MLNNYDKIAGSYDFLSRLIFQKSQVYAQIDQLANLPSQSKILIVGGGTGWILNEITNLKLAGIEITYVEISMKMIEKAKRKLINPYQIQFINCAIEDFKTVEQYDAIHTAFLFDNFALPRVEKVFQQLDTLLKPGGLWLFSDFHYEHQTTHRWKGFVLKMMYTFFDKIAQVEAKTLVSTAPYFHQKHYRSLIEKDYYHSFIKAIVYQKPPATKTK